MVTSILIDPALKRLQKLMRHIEEVRTNCEILGTKLIESGEFDCGRMLIASGIKHDASKFEEPEWDHLWDRQDPLFNEAWSHHVLHNDHHPEFWGSIHDMPRRSLAECVCDWAGRSSEFGTALRPWIEEKATVTYSFSQYDRAYQDIQYFLNMLLEPSFI